MDFTNDPALDERNVLTSWDWNWFTLMVEPGVGIVSCYISATLLATTESYRAMTDRPADMLGHSVALQIAALVL